MPGRNDVRTLETALLLEAGEPPPYRILNENIDASLVLLCDHASCRIPRALGNLGLDDRILGSHLGWDIGAGALTETLAQQLGVPAILAGYSRLVVDCNRDLADAQAFLETGDGQPIPGNRGLLADARSARVAAIYAPYHRAIDGLLDRLEAGGQSPAVLAIHSFTPIFAGRRRPWQFGILWDKDPSVPGFLMPALAEAGFVVGDNQPYSGRAPEDYTIDHHAEARRLPHAGIEIRQDLLADAGGVAAIADVLAPLLHSLRQRAARAD